MRAILVGLLLVSSGCARDDDAIRAEVQLLTVARGEQATEAAEHLAKSGRRAIVPIEAALHTADESGRKNLIIALRKIGDPEAVPLLRHIAEYDAAPEVKREALWTLRGWAAGAKDDPRAEAARRALRELDEAGGRQEAG